jgi:hypothetical protein
MVEIKTLLSKILNSSPYRNASVTVNQQPDAGQSNAQAGAGAGTVGVPLLGEQGSPRGSAGKHPVASTPTSVILNWYQLPFGETALVPIIGGFANPIFPFSLETKTPLSIANAGLASPAARTSVKIPDNDIALFTEII